MSAKKQSRKWCITINNPIEKGFTHEKLNSTLQKKGRVVATNDALYPLRQGRLW